MKKIIRKHYTDEDGCVAYTAAYQSTDGLSVPQAWDHNECPDGSCKLFKTCGCFWAYEQYVKRGKQKIKKSMIK